MPSYQVKPELVKSVKSTSTGHEWCSKKGTEITKEGKRLLKNNARHKVAADGLEKSMVRDFIEITGWAGSLGRRQGLVNKIE